MLSSCRRPVIVHLTQPTLCRRADYMILPPEPRRPASLRRLKFRFHGVPAHWEAWFMSAGPRRRRQVLPGTLGVSLWLRRVILSPSQTSGSYLRPTTRSFIGISALSVILMCSGHTSVQHLVMLQ